jgi:hypothetical protein
MRFTGRFTYMDYDPKTYKKSFDEAMQTQMRQAARAWLRAMLSAELPVVRRGTGSSTGIPPVWTGTARGTLIPLGRFLKIAIPISPRVRRPGWGPSVGAAQGKFQFGTLHDRHYFRFSTQLAYYTLNEFNQSDLHLTHKTPWNGFEIGQAAFQDYCNTEMVRKLPKIRDAIKFKTRIIQ